MKEFAKDERLEAWLYSERWLAQARNRVAATAKESPEAAPFLAEMAVAERRQAAGEELLRRRKEAGWTPNEYRALKAAGIPTQYACDQSIDRAFVKKVAGMIVTVGWIEAREQWAAEVESK